MGGIPRGRNSVGGIPWEESHVGGIRVGGIRWAQFDGRNPVWEESCAGGIRWAQSRAGGIMLGGIRWAQSRVGGILRAPYFRNCKIETNKKYDVFLIEHLDTTSFLGTFCLENRNILLKKKNILIFDKLDNSCFGTFCLENTNILLKNGNILGTT